MSELRWNPILREWVVTATHRQNRPLLPTHPSNGYPATCPFCVGAEEVPTPYEVLALPNRFPSFQSPPPPPDVKSDDFYLVRPAEGLAEVVLYSSEHNSSLAKQSLPRINKLISLLQERYLELGSKKFVKYVFFFENRGEVIGVTLPHPHGQIYAFPFIPIILERELKSSKNYFTKNKKCLHCEVIKREIKCAKRIVYQNECFVAFVPFYARWPYEVHLYPKRHQEGINDLKDKEKEYLSHCLKIILNKYDNLFGLPFPYMMIIHQKPTDGKNYPFYHFHFEFYSPQRAKNKIKYLAGCESGAGNFVQDTIAEKKAEELRRA